ncbi:hypothetical protein SAMN05421819_2647 [Bryocella elongata]|uniref:YcxB-like C-terminal domain-containing protein n=1 Tax=Bryocella elongata TaxID=863522 RepID=A0A1H5ZJE2_9BACT|nr:YcxB family protein [Bryocella elongata]SEG35536.1 hypothetical protein SAMN05421819_2647 [Bryocella elongata]
MIETTFRSTFEEWSEGQTLWCRNALSKSPQARLHHVVKLSLPWGAGIMMVIPPHWPGFLVMAILVIDLIVSKWRRPRIMRWLFDRDPDRQQDVFVRIDESGYYSQREGLTECRMTWASFSGWKEGPRTIILGRHGKYCFLPKRVLTEEQLHLLRNLCQTRIATAPPSR